MLSLILASFDKKFFDIKDSFIVKTQRSVNQSISESERNLFEDLGSNQAELNLYLKNQGIKFNSDV